MLSDFAAPPCCGGTVGHVTDTVRKLQQALKGAKYIAFQGDFFSVIFFVKFSEPPKGACDI